MGIKNILQRGVWVGLFVSVALANGCGSDKGGDDNIGGSGGEQDGGTGGNLSGGEGGGPLGGAGGGEGGGGIESGGSGGEGGYGTGGEESGTGGTGGESEGPSAEITPGAATRFLLKGTVVTPDTFFEGQVLVEQDLLTCVKPGTECETMSGASGATIIETNGIIAPGLIDSHNHILFDIFNEDDWVPVITRTACSTAADCKTSNPEYCTGTADSARCACVDNVCRYRNHNYWIVEDEYGVILDYKQCMENASQGKPVWCPAAYFNSNSKYDCEMNKWGELKGLISGTTSIVGLPGASSQCYASLARTVTQTASLSDLPVKIKSGSCSCADLTSGNITACFVHAGEGVNGAALNNFNTLFSYLGGCLIAPPSVPAPNFNPGVTVIHGTAFTAVEYQKMADWGMKLIWSPASDVTFYGVTNDLPAAIAAGLTIAMGPDWSTSGSQNMLDEMRFAKQWDAGHYGNILTPKAIVQMATVNGAAVLALANSIGRLSEGFKADLFVVGGNQAAPYDAILAATPTTVRLVMVNGKVLYGDDQLEAAGPASPGCEPLNVCGRNKFVCVAESSTSNKLNQTMVQIRDALNTALQDLDSITPLSASECSPACGASEECYERTVWPIVDTSLCAGGSCPSGQNCYQRAQTGSNMYECSTPNACATKRPTKFHPVAPLTTCP